MSKGDFETRDNVRYLKAETECAISMFCFGHEGSLNSVMLNTYYAHARKMASSVGCCIYGEHTKCIVCA